MSLLLDALKAAAKEKEHKASLDADAANEARSNRKTVKKAKFKLAHSNLISNNEQPTDQEAANSDLSLEDIIIADLDREALDSSTHFTTEFTSESISVDDAPEKPTSSSPAPNIGVGDERLSESFSLEPSIEENFHKKDNLSSARVNEEPSALESNEPSALGENKETSAGDIESPTILGTSAPDFKQPPASPLENEPFADSVHQLQETLETLTQTVESESKLLLSETDLKGQAEDPFNLFNDESLYENDIAESEQPALEPKQDILQLEVNKVDSTHLCDNKSATEPTPSDQTTNTNDVPNSDLLAEFGISADEIAAATPIPTITPKQTSAPTAKASNYDPLEILVKSGRKEAKRNRHLMQGAFGISILMIFASGYYFYTQMATEYHPPLIAMSQAPEPFAQLAAEIEIPSVNKAVSGPNINTIEIESNISEAPSMDPSNDKINSNNKNKSTKAVIPIKGKEIAQSKPVSKPPIEESINTKKAIKKPVKKLSKSEVKSKSKSRTKAKSAVSAQSIGDLNNQAYALFHQRAYSEALSLYDQVLTHQPRNRDGLLGKAAIALINSDTDQASQLYKALLQINPKDLTARAALTSIHQSSNTQLHHSELLFQIRENPQSHVLHFALGNLYATAQNWQGAQDSYFNAWSIEADNADYCYNLAISSDQLNQPKHALKLYRKSLLLAQSYHSNFPQQLVKERIDQLNDRLGIAQWERVIER